MTVIAGPTLCKDSFPSSTKTAFASMYTTHWLFCCKSPVHGSICTGTHRAHTHGHYMHKGSQPYRTSCFSFCYCAVVFRPWLRPQMWILIFFCLSLRKCDKLAAEITEWKQQKRAKRIQCACNSAPGCRVLILGQWLILSHVHMIDIYRLQDPHEESRNWILWVLKR